MKKYLYRIAKKCSLLTCISLMLLSSCSKDVLNETPLDFLAPDNAYNTISGIRQGITGLHINLRDAWYNGTYQDQWSILNGSLGTDVAYHGETPGGNIKLVNYKNEMTSANPIFTHFWTKSYQLIQMANVLIKGINESDNNIWVNPAQKNAFLAEARFFRAWAYRFLVVMYGDVPLVTEVVNSAKTDFTRAPKAEVYKVIEDDLQFAAANLPAPGSEEGAGRVTQGAAWHYLSEVYLNQAKFQLSVDAATKVIDGYQYALMTQRFGTRLGKDVLGSGDVYFDLFGFGNFNLPENKESIWVIQIEPLVTGGFDNISEKCFGPAYFRMGNTPDGKLAFRGELVNGKYTGYSDTIGRPTAWVRPTYYASTLIWQSDWNNDIRNASHNIKRDFYYDSPGSAYDKKKVDFSLYPAGSRDGIRDTCQYIFPVWMKFYDPTHHFTDPARSGGGNNNKDIYNIRLAETLLLRAEAFVGVGNKVAAAADINKIRSRAKATPVDPANVDLDYILDERTRELYGEEWRHITLRRMGKLLERTRKFNNNPVFPACNIQDYNVLLPIPQSQIDLNINGVIKQNPGYPQ